MEAENKFDSQNVEEKSCNNSYTVDLQLKNIETAKKTRF